MLQACSAAASIASCWGLHNNLIPAAAGASKVTADQGFLEACPRACLAAMGHVYSLNRQLPGHRAKALTCRQGRPSAQQHKLSLEATRPLTGHTSCEWGQEEVLEVAEGAVCRLHTAAYCHGNQVASEGPRSAARREGHPGSWTGGRGSWLHVAEGGW